MLYIIRTELKQPEAIERMVAKHFPGFHTHRGRGFWEGKPELDFTIEVIAPASDLDKIRELAKWIMEFNPQTSVVVQRLECEIFWFFNE